MRVLAFALLATAAACGPAPALRASALQLHPKPLGGGAEVLPRSEKLYVFEPTNQPHVRRHNTAEFVVVTRDRLRFHFLSSAGPTERYTVWLEDESGRRYQPTREGAKVERMVHPRWRFPTSPWCAAGGCGYQDAWLRVGTVDYVFTAPGIMSPERKKLVLHVDRHEPLRSLEFSWTFGDGTDVRHCFVAHDAEDGNFVSIPGPGTLSRDSRYEADAFSYLPRK